tara:strand:+ start:876 stop:1046 length:171 start_codon:yes stop_codon:yes gene_type:complete
MDRYDLVHAVMLGLVVVIATSPAVAGFLARGALASLLLFAGIIDQETANAIFNSHF